MTRLSSQENNTPSYARDGWNTDEWPADNQLAQHFAAHNRVRHTEGENVVSAIRTNTVEELFGRLKPLIGEAYRKMSHKWLQGYPNEFTTTATRRTAMFKDASAVGFANERLVG